MKNNRQLWKPILDGNTVFPKDKFDLICERFKGLAAVSVSVFCLNVADTAKAATLYWDVNGTGTGFSTVVGGWNGTNLFFNNTASGTGGTMSATVGSANDLVISQATTNTGSITLTGTQAASSITFAANVGPTTTITGGTLTIGGTGTTSGIVQSSTGANTVASAISLNAASTIRNTSTGVLTISGGITGSQNLILQNNGATANGVTISGTSLNNTGTVTNSGSGTGNTLISAVIGANVTGVTQNSATSSLTLSGANTYTSATTLTAGILSITHGSALGTVATGTTQSGSSELRLSGGITTLAEALSISGGGISNAGALRNFSGNNTYAGTITMAAQSRINSDSGTLTLSAGNSVTGAFTLVVGGAGNTTISGTITTGGGGLIKDGAGTLLLSGTNTYTGATTISAGAVTVNNAAALGTTAGGVSVASGAALQLNAFAVGAEALTLNGTGISNGGALRGLTGTSSYGGAVTLGSASRINTDAGTMTLSGAIGGAFGLTVGGASNTTLSGNIAAAVTSVTKDGAGLLTLSGTNAYAGTSSVTGGALAFTTTAAIPGYATSPATAFGTFASPRITTASGTTVAFPFGGANSITTTDITGFLDGTYGIFAAGSSLGIDTTNASPSPANLTTIITDTTAGMLGFTKTGTNALMVNSANTYTGQTRIVGGTLIVPAIGNVGAVSGYLGAPANATDGTISLGGGSSTGILSYTGGGETTDRVINLAGTTGGGGIDNSGTGTLVFSNPMTFGAGAKTLTISGASNITFSGALAGGAQNGTTPLTIQKDGAGTLLLGAAGPTNTNVATRLNITGGIVDIGPSGLTLSNLGADVITPTADATINATGGGVLTLSSITGLGGADIRPPVNTTLTINANIATPTANGSFWTGQGGALELNGAGTLVLNGTNVIGGGTVITVANGTISVGNIATNLGGTTGFTFTAAGSRFRYTGNGETSALPFNTGAATATIDQSGPSGTLNLSAPFSGHGAAKTLTLQGSTGGEGVMSGIISNNTTFATSITKAGAGTWTLSGANTYTGATNVNAGRLVLTTGTTGNSAVSVNSTGTLAISGNYTIGNAGTAAAGGSLILNSGGLLDLADGAINTLTLTQNATFATAGAAFNGGSIRFDVSGSGADSIVNSGGTVGSTSSGLNAIVINPITGFAAGGAYTIISGGAGSGSINVSSNFFLATNTVNFGGSPFTLALSQSGKDALLTVTAGASGDPAALAFWNGTTDSSWTTQPGGLGTATNWVAAAPGGPDTFSLPGSATNLFMTSNAVGAGGLTTTIDAVSAINSLNFTGTGTSNTAGSNVNLGTGTSLTINAATVNGNTAGNGITVMAGSGANTINVPVELGASQTWTNNSTNPLSFTGNVSGSGLTLTTAGTGIIQIGNGGTTGTVATDVSLVTNGNLAFNRSNTVTQGTDFASISGTGIVTQNGSGTLVLSGANTYTGNTVVNSGTLNLPMGGSLTGNGTTTTGSTLNVGTVGGQNAVVNVSGGNINSYYSFGLGTVANSVGVLNMTGGSYTGTGTQTNNTINFVGQAGYGYLNITGGTFAAKGRFAPSNGVGTTGVMYIGGTGTFDHTAGEWFLMAYSAAGNGGLSQITVGPGGNLNRVGASNNFGLNMDRANGYAVLSIAGGQMDNGIRTVTFGNGNATVNTTGILNLAAGTLTVGVPMANNTGTGTGNTGYLNFAGGTLRTSAGITAIIPASSAGQSIASRIYGVIDNSAVSGAPSFVGGLTVDTNGFNSTLTNALLAPTGTGVRQADLTVSGGAGYVGAPAVQFSKPASGGSPASGYALISGGQVTGIVITSPGDYASGETPSVTLTGGGASTAATVTVAALNTANTSGGLTKSGNGVLTLSGANTYTGGTNITGGTLALGAANVLADTGAVNVNGGTFDIAAFNDNVGALTLASGSITGTTGVLTPSGTTLESGSISAILGGSGAVTKSSAGTVTLSGVNSYSGVTSITGGTLAFSAANNLGNGTATNTITLNGGTLSYTGSTSINLAATQIMTVGGSGGTLNTSEAAGTLNLPGITSSTAANLTKTGLGTVNVTGSVNLTGGNVTVSAGVLNAGFTPTGLGAINVANAATLNLYDAATTTMGISGLTLASGSSLGFDLNAPSVNDVLNLTGSASVTPGVLLNFNNLGGLTVGNYNLINVTSGTLTSTDYVLGLAPSGFNYTFSTINADTTLRLTASQLALRYWTGDQDGNWNTDNGPGNTNWASDATGATELGALPATTDTLVFSATNVVGPTIATSLNNVAVTADSLRFINATTPATTTVTVASGGAGGILTINPISSNNGITVAGSGGDITISAPVVALANQTWEVNGAVPSSLTMDGNVTFTGSVTKTGAGSLTLSGANSGAGGVNLVGGILNINSNNALGAGSFTIGTGTTIDSTVAGVTIGNAQTWDGNFTFTGTNSLNLGTGNVTLGANVGITAAASTLTVGGIIDDGASTFGLTKTGAGALTLGGANTFGGGVTLSAGTLNIGHNNTGTTNALGTGSLTINGGTIDNTSGAAITANGGNNAQAWNGSFTFTGTNSLNLGSGNVALGATPTVTVSASTLTVGGIISGGFGLTKAGAGTLILGGASTYTGATTINDGILKIGVANALPTPTALTLSGTSTLDLSGNNQTVASAVSVAGNTITNTAAGTGTNTLTVNNLAAPGTVSIAALITDGPTAKTAIRAANGNAGTQITSNSANTFSGGLILANPASGVGTRLRIDAITGTPWGTGPIIIGESATDRAGIYFATANQTLANPIVFNTALGTDRVGIRTDVAGITLSGVITANLAPATFTANTATAGAFTLTNQVTGASGLVLDIVSLSASATQFLVTLNNGTINANNYQGDTVINFNAANTKSATLALGAANQIPNGTGTGNVIINTNGTGVGRLNMGGFNETINGLSGNGTVEGASTGTPTNTLTLGDNNATGLTFSGLIQNSAGTLSLTKIGSGTQTLSGANTFSGNTLVSAGTIALGNALALQNSAYDTASANGGLDATGFATPTLGGLTGSVNLSPTLITAYGSITNLTLKPLTGITQIHSGAIPDGATGMVLTKSGAGTQELNGVVSNTGGIDVTLGTLRLGNSGNTYTGTTDISAAVAGIIVTADGALGATGTGNETTIGANGALGFSGGINYSAVEKIIGSGTGGSTAAAGFAVATRGFIQSVSGNNTFAGDIELSANGTSRIGTQTGAQLTLSGAITQGTGVTTANILFRVGDNNGDFVTLSNAGNSFGGDSTVFTGLVTAGEYAGVRLGVDNALPTNLTISGFSGTGAGAALDLNGNDQTLNGLVTGGGAMNIINLDTVNASTLTLNPTVNKTTSNTIILGGGSLGTINLVKDGAFSQTLSSSANSFTGNIEINGGALISAAGINALNPVTSALGNPQTPGRTITIGSTGTLTFGTANDALGNAGSTPLVKIINNGGVINNTGTAFTSLGPVDLNGGTITAVGGASANYGSFRLAGTVTVGGTTASTISATGTNSQVGLNTTGTTFDVADVTGDNTSDLNVSAVLANVNAVAGNLTKSGLGTLSLSGVNTYTGPTTIDANSGTLALTGAGSLNAGAYAGAISIGSGSTLQYNSSAAQTLSGLLSGAGSLVKDTSLTSVLTLSGVNTGFTGSVTVNGGTLAITNNDALGTTAAATTVNGANGGTGTTLSLTSATSGLTIAENLNLFGTVAGRATLVNNGAFHHTLTGAIDVSSDTNLAQFTSSNNSGSITVTGDITGTLSGGAVLFVRGNSTNASNRILGSVNLTGGNFAKTDGGIWLLGAPGKTYNWVDTLVAVGTLKMGVAGVLPTTSELRMGNATAGASVSTLDLNGFSQLIKGVVYNGAGVASGTKTITNSDVANSAVLTVNNATDYTTFGDSAANSIVLTGNLGLTKQGIGTLTITGANTYTGPTNISGGTLALSGGGVLANSNTVNLTMAGTALDISGITGTEVIGTLTGVASSTVKLGGSILELGTNSDFAFAGSAEDGGLGGGTGGSIKKTGTGVMTLSGSNTYTGATDISGGTLLLGANNVLPNTAALNLSGGTTFNSGGFSDATGPLSIATSATIDLGSGSSSNLTFTNTGAWSGLLSIWNYTGGAIWSASSGDTLNFTANGLTSTDLANIQFYTGNQGDFGSAIGVGAGFIGSELVPVPEPTALAAALLLGAIGFQGRRRPRARARRF